MAYYSVINTEANHSLNSELSVLDSKLSVFSNENHRNIGIAGQSTISAATTENIISFIIALILLPFSDMEMRHINFGDKSLSIIADRSDIENYFSSVVETQRAKCGNGMLGKEIVFVK